MLRGNAGVADHRDHGLVEAVRRASRELRGAYAVACVSADEPETLVAVRSGSSPLVIGIGDGEMFLASDIPALLGETRERVADRNCGGHEPDATNSGRPWGSP